MKRLLIVATLLALLFPAAAFAQQSEGTAYKKVTEYEFNGMNVSGKLDGPMGERIRTIRREQSGGLYEPRQNWIPELLESPKEL